MGLNETYSQSRNQIMMMSLTPTINKAYSMIIAEESRGPMTNFAQTSAVNEEIAIFCGKGTPQVSTSYKTNKNNLFCDYCNYKGHTRDTCYKLHGYPSNFKPKRKTKLNNVSQYTRAQTSIGSSNGGFEAIANCAGHSQQSSFTSTSQGGQGVIAGVPQFTADQYNQILYLLGESSITSISQVDQPSNVMSASMISPSIVTKVEIRWIVDISASNHIVKSLKYLEESKTVDESSIGKVNLPTERIASVRHIGSTSVLQGQKITNVLHIPDFKYNLLSISKLTKELRCSALFYPDFCLFRDFLNGRVGVLVKRIKVFASAYQSLGIVHHSSCVYTPQRNRVAERRRRHMLNVARALRFQAVYTIKRLPTQVLQGKTPFELLFGHSSSLDHVEIFGCLVYVTDVKRGDKFSPRASPAIFLGYSIAQNGYRMCNIHTKEFLVSRDVLFKENLFPFQHPDSLPSLLPEIDIPQVLVQSTQAATEIEPELLAEPNHNLSTHQTSIANNHLVETSPIRRFGRTSKPPIWLKEYATNP
ncbi:uncharacterized protein LOC107763039 [Nicotiana tabacum]|uniref:uncharacterized protein LOC107763039 n=1 Tax=Nicotiana tabacum TaxID=4097 RepID=UPI003F4EB39C